MNIEQKEGINVPNSYSSEAVEEISTKKRIVLNSGLCFSRALIDSSVSVWEYWPHLTKFPVFLRLLACRCVCIFTHLNYTSGNKSVGMFTVPVLA